MNLSVHTSNPYEIIVERGCLSRVGELTAKLFRPGARAVVVTDSNVLPLYAKTVTQSLGAGGLARGTVEINARGGSKRG